MKAPFLLGIIATSLFGLADAGFISYEKIAGITPSCYLTGIFHCSQVLSSPWAYLGPWPLSFYGVGFYLAVLAVAIACLVLPKPPAYFTKLLTALAVFGFGFSLYLMAIQTWLIQAFCFFCVLSALSASLIFLLTLGGWYWSRRETKHDQTT